MNGQDVAGGFRPASLDGILGSDRPLEGIDKTVTVDTASIMVLSHNPLRTWATLINDGAGIIYLQFGNTAAANTGIRLNPQGGSCQIDRNMPWTGNVHAIATVASVLLIHEISVAER